MVASTELEDKISRKIGMIAFAVSSFCNTNLTNVKIVTAFIALLTRPFHASTENTDNRFNLKSQLPFF
jgi:hypothetical protein